jgi:mRNA-degrading endonuclease RelE of RelBE toxin-antitoxin system
MLTVIETPLFLRYAADIWDEHERETFVDWIALRPDAGDVIPGTGGLRKLRWSRAGMGKQGGARIIYFVQNDQGTLILLLVYAKAKFDNLSSKYLRRVKELFDGSGNEKV